ncbi:phage baseplate assembly protein V [Paraburkholderia silviterrae]|uniref:Phage baseplate assembly protein V n=1 Tax=Paraburkholderia silviterrae TaxID=2528715 RepID=A0A4R5MAQ4_9BURK|nr:phage baseplate assembly protein V [Paraburkholderia silviterrae]TDG23214.1 phage baseplate assembly protein V [Paraburkholderia silviterrae]
MTDDYSERHYLRTMLTVRRGRISLVNDSGSIQKLQLAPSGLETRDNIPRMAEYGLASNPPAGSDAMIINVGGDTSNGAVVGTNHQETRPTGLKSGETMLYNGPAGTSLYLANGQVVLNANGQPVNVNGATIVMISASTEVIFDTPVLKCTGDIVDNYETNSSTLKQLRAAHDGHDHEVVDVQTGGSTITTTPPNLTV